MTISPVSQPSAPETSGQLVGFRPAIRTVAEIRGARALVVQLMSGAMVREVHFGTIPGTPKPTLYKPGAEMLLSMLRFGARPLQCDDLSSYDEIRYRVQVEIFDQASGTSLGVGIGECSSSEKKYRWRAPVCSEEFDETPEDRRRVVWMRSGKDATQKQQVRTDPADIANTVLKMAKKRALIDATLTVTAASDVFGQDAEDLPAEWGAFHEEGAVIDAEVIGEEPRSEPKPAVRPAGDGLRVVGVRVARKGTNDKGDWKKYGIKFSDGREAFSFSEDAKKAADSLLASHAIVDRETELNEKFNEHMLVILREAK